MIGGLGGPCYALLVSVQNHQPNVMDDDDDDDDDDDGVDCGQEDAGPYFNQRWTP